MTAIAYVAKKAISAFLHPVGLCLTLLFAGLVLLRRKQNGRLGYLLLCLAALGLLITSLPITGFLLLRPLEDMAGPRANPEDLKRLGVSSILVLGGGGVSDWRVVEGIRLWRHVPESRLILSGGQKGEGKPIQELPPELGVPEAALDFRPGAVDTAGESSLFAATVGPHPFALVTSAYHMPRAIGLFRAMGLNPVAAPCEHRAEEFPAWQTCLLPNADSLLSTQLAIHEYMGIAWQWLKQETRKALR
jgi:uncharacterized SAM-binding protein YcdF (DUF218 family)